MALWNRQPRQTFRIGQPTRVDASRNKLAGGTSGGSALVAAGHRVERREAANLRRLIMPWQVRAFGYYDQLGEIKYAAQFYSRMLAPLRLYAAEKDENGDLVESSNPKAKDALERIQDPGGGRSGLLSTYGRLMFLTGEAYLLCSIDPETGLEQWEMLSPDELRLMDGVYMRYRAPTLMAENYEPAPEGEYAPLEDDQAVVYRFWKRHPRYSALADATMQGVLDLCEELLLLTRAVRARARSRTAGSGILFLDESITTTPSEPVGDEDPLEDPFIGDLTEAMTTPIVDEGTAAAVVPLIARVSAPEQPDGSRMRIQDLVYHLQIIDPTQLYPETGLRRECIDRLAIGLDMPAEVLTGLADINHWGAWQVDEQTWKSHGQPIAQQLCDDLTSSYFRLELRDAGVENWQSFSVAYDASAVINHPDRTKDAKELYNLGELSGKALRDTAGFAEEDAPSEEERRWWLGWKVGDAGFAVTGIPTRISQAEVTAGDTEVEGAQEPADVEPGIPDSSAGGDASIPAESVIGAARVIGAAELALLRAREAAGNRIRSYAKRDQDTLDVLRGVKTSQTAAALGRDRVRALGAPGELELVSGIRDLFGECLDLFGLKEEAIVDALGESLERHAARTLYDERPPPLPSQLANMIHAASAPSNGHRRRSAARG